MEEFTSRYRSVSILLGVLFLQFVLLGYQVKRGENVQLGRGWATAVMAPFQTALSGGVGTVGSFWKDYLWLYGVRDANERLLSENKELRSRVQQLGVALSRFSREEELLAYQKQSPSQTLLARVIGVGSHPNAREISIDKGTGDGVKAGMAVITPEGVAGVVQAAYARTSLVLLLNDVDYYKATRFLLCATSETDRIPFQIDGDYLCDLPVEIQVIPSALPVYAPPRGDD